MTAPISQVSHVGSDIDGTLLAYNTAQSTRIVINHELIALMRSRSVRRVTLITNQAGIPFRLQTGNTKYPTPEMFGLRLVLLIGALEKAGIQTVSVYISLWHDKARREAIEQASIYLDDIGDTLLTNVGVPVYPQKAQSFRKPRPDMLLMAGIKTFYGDSSEDAEAASAARATFYKVDRFYEQEIENAVS